MVLPAALKVAGRDSQHAKSQTHTYNPTPVRIRRLALIRTDGQSFTVYPITKAKGDIDATSQPNNPRPQRLRRREESSGRQLPDLAKG